MGIVNFHDSFLQPYCLPCDSNAQSLRSGAVLSAKSYTSICGGVVLKRLAGAARDTLGDKAMNDAKGATAPGSVENTSRKGPQNCRSLGSAPPDFLWNLVALRTSCAFLKRKAHTRSCPVQRGRKSGSG